LIYLYVIALRDAFIQIYNRKNATEKLKNHKIQGIGSETHHIFKPLEPSCRTRHC